MQINAGAVVGLAYRVEERIAEGVKLLRFHYQD